MLRRLLVLLVWTCLFVASCFANEDLDIAVRDALDYLHVRGASIAFFDKVRTYWSMHRPVASDKDWQQLTTLYHL